MSMRPTAFVIGIGLVLTIAVAARRAGADTAGNTESVAAAGNFADSCSGEPCDAVARGRITFRDQRLDGLGGNGRSCADCHMPRNHFALSPADVEDRYQLLQLVRRSDPLADDPLFRPIDADDFRIN